MTEFCHACGHALEPLAEVHQLTFAADSETSRQAALANWPRAGSQRARVLDALAARPSTRDELAALLRLPQNSIRPRVRELIDGGWAYATGTTRPTATGCEAEVLALTERSRRELDEAAA